MLFSCLRYLHHIYFIILMLHSIYSICLGFVVNWHWFILIFLQSLFFFCTICTKCLHWHNIISKVKLLDCIVCTCGLEFLYTNEYIIIIYSYYSVAHKDECKLRLMVKFCKIAINFSYHHMHKIMYESFSNKICREVSQKFCKWYTTR